MAKKESTSFPDLIHTISGGMDNLLSGSSSLEKEPEEPPKSKERKLKKGNYSDFFEPGNKKESIPVLTRISGENEQKLKRLYQLSRLKGCTLPFYAYLDNIIEKHLEQYSKEIEEFEQSVFE